METKVFVIYLVEGQVYGYDYHDTSPSEAIRRFGSAYDLRGKAAHFICVSDDPGISRADAVRFSDAVYRGKYVNYHIDLAPLNEGIATKTLKRRNGGR